MAEALLGIIPVYVIKNETSDPHFHDQKHKVLLNRDYPIRPIDRNPLPGADALCGTWHAYHCRDTILAGNDSSVGNHAAHFHD